MKKIRSVDVHSAQQAYAWMDVQDDSLAVAHAE